MPENDDIQEILPGTELASGLLSLMTAAIMGLQYAAADYERFAVWCGQKGYPDLGQAYLTACDHAAGIYYWEIRAGAAVRLHRAGRADRARFFARYLPMLSAMMQREPQVPSQRPGPQA